MSLMQDEERAQRCFVWIAIIGAVAFIVTCGIALAKDDAGRWVDNPLHNWFQKLASGKGLCCSLADGVSIQDPDWRTEGNHYQVHYKGAWIDVPEDAVITEPNLDGRTWVWPLEGMMGTTIRCFMPGALT